MCIAAVPPGTRFFLPTAREPLRRPAHGLSREGLPGMRVETIQSTEPECTEGKWY